MVRASWTSVKRVVNGETEADQVGLPEVGDDALGHQLVDQAAGFGVADRDVAAPTIRSRGVGDSRPSSAQRSRARPVRAMALVRMAAMPASATTPAAA